MSDLIDRLRYRAAARDDGLATEAADRIEQLEAALQKIADVVDAAVYGPMPKRQENDDVFKGFRGNNDNA